MQSLKQIIEKIGGDPYELLETDPSAPLQTIRKNYRSMAFRYHPDKNKQDSAKMMFLKINRAFEFLEEDSNRRMYAENQKALQQYKKRVQNMGEQRRKLAKDLQRREQEYLKSKKQMDEELIKRKTFFEKKMQEQEQRERIRHEILEQMRPQNYYQQVSAITVEWDPQIAFNQFLLQKAFQFYGKITQIECLQPKRNQAKLIFSSIEVCTKVIHQFSHPLITVRSFLPLEKRARMLKALKDNSKDSKVDLTLNSDTIARLKEIVNRNSNLYTNYVPDF